MRTYPTQYGLGQADYLRNSCASATKKSAGPSLSHERQPVLPESRSVMSQSSMHNAAPGLQRRPGQPLQLQRCNDSRRGEGNALGKSNALGADDGGRRCCSEEA